MSIASALSTLRAVRDAIRSAIVGKGSTLPAGSPMSAYPAAIKAIRSAPDPVDATYKGNEPHDMSPKIGLTLAEAITNLDGFKINISDTTDFSYMFRDCKNLTSVPALDVSVGTSPSSFFGMFGNCPSLTQIGIYGFRYEMNISGCKLDAKALNAFFTQAGTARTNWETITITGNPGASTCNKKIATNKGWTVTG